MGSTWGTAPVVLGASGSRGVLIGSGAAEPVPKKNFSISASRNLRASGEKAPPTQFSSAALSKPNGVIVAGGTLNVVGTLTTAALNLPGFVRTGADPSHR